MHQQVTDQITINAPASKVWRILAHEFDQVGQWSSGITESMAIADCPIPAGATVGGRVCLSNGFGADVQEAFTDYDEEGMRFGYQAIGDLPWFFESAGNNWHVQALGPNQSLVAFRAEIEMKFFLGLFMVLLTPLIKRIWGTRTLEELKYYVEHDQPHPRKMEARQKQMKAN